MYTKLTKFVFADRNFWMQWVFSKTTKSNALKPLSGFYLQKVRHRNTVAYHNQWSTFPLRVCLTILIWHTFVIQYTLFQSKFGIQGFTNHYLKHEPCVLYTTAYKSTTANLITHLSLDIIEQLVRFIASLSYIALSTVLTVFILHESSESFYQRDQQIISELWKLQDLITHLPYVCTIKFDDRNCKNRVSHLE